MRGFLVTLVMLSLAASAQAQPAPMRLGSGLHLQAYPAGVIVGGRFSVSFGRRDALLAYAGYNTTDRRDWGEHDDEEGGGPGFGFAWRHYLADGPSGLHFGVRTDLWLLNIDWIRRAPMNALGPDVRGRTEVTVWQPTAQAGYTLLLGDLDRLQLEGTLSLGAEVNLATEGEAVGQGAILLGGVGLAYRF